MYEREYDPFIEGVKQFKYLGRILEEADSDWQAVQRNNNKARIVWWRLVKLLIREGGDSHVSELFYKEVFQSVVLFGSESWALLDAMMRALESTHVGFICHITGK